MRKLVITVYVITVLGFLLSLTAHAASLAWDYTPTGTAPTTATIQRSPTATGTFAPLATIPAVPSTWTLPDAADNLWYRISAGGGVSNVVQYTPTLTVVGPAGPQGIQGIPGPTGPVGPAGPIGLTGSAGPIGPQGIPGLNGIMGVPGPMGMTGQAGTPADMTRVQALEARVTQLEQAAAPVVTPPVTGPLTSKLLDPTHLEITCTGTSIKTTGSGLKRVVECIP